MAFSIYNREEVRKVLAAVSEEHGITLAQLVGPMQGKAIVRARRSAARLLAAPPYTMSSPEIGKHLGGRHHTSILHLIKTPDPSWKPRTVAMMEPVKRGILDDLDSQLSRISKRRDTFRQQIDQLDALEAEVRASRARVEQVA